MQTLSEVLPCCIVFITRAAAAHCVRKQMEDLMLFITSTDVVTFAQSQCVWFDQGRGTITRQDSPHGLQAIPVAVSESDQ